ncbi:MAG TPA: HPr kinase/phosphatase C-terminal domain-containing protein [Acetobacteraceae bacterium]|jgi:HPr kinase/phosphorylase|nr:HPr kinase/phosphatase C-terminal domain-containing protein [Acetobacteraceae bacterium]
MQIHASCAARDGAGVLILGASGAGKSDMVLRLIDRGFILVADDRVIIENGLASPVASLAGLIEVRGLGLLRLPFQAPARLALAIELTGPPERLPMPMRHPTLDLPLCRLDPRAASAAQRAVLALDCALGRISQAAGAFAPKAAMP